MASGRAESLSIISLFVKSVAHYRHLDDAVPRADGVDWGNDASGALPPQDRHFYTNILRVSFLRKYVAPGDLVQIARLAGAVNSMFEDGAERMGPNYAPGNIDKVQLPVGIRRGGEEEEDEKLAELLRWYVYRVALHGPFNAEQDFERLPFAQRILIPTVIVAWVNHVETLIFAADERVRTLSAQEGWGIERLPLVYNPVHLGAMRHMRMS